MSSGRETSTRGIGTAHRQQKLLSSPQQACLEATERERQPADDVRLLLFLVPVICLCPPRLISSHLISSQCQSHCVSYHPGHRTLVYNLRTSNIFSLRLPLLVLGCPTPACPKDQVIAWCCSVQLCAQCVRLPPTLIPSCNLPPPTLQLWRILHA